MSVKRCTADRRDVLASDKPTPPPPYTLKTEYTHIHTLFSLFSFSLSQHTSTQTPPEEHVCWSGSMDPPGGCSALVVGVRCGLWALVLKGFVQTGVFRLVCSGWPVQAGLLRLVCVGWGLG